MREVPDLFDHHSDGTPVEENITILSSPYFPDNEEAHKISSRIQVRSKRIDSLQCMIQELCAQRDALQLTNAIGQSLLAPIRKLPSEILAEIFTQCMPKVHMPLDGNDYEYELDRTYSNYNVARSRHPTFIRLGLTQVSRRWREIISDTPSMWTSLVLNHSFPEDFTSIVQMSLRNSKNCLLDVFIVPRAWRIPSEVVYETMDLLNSQIHRFRCFFADLKYTSGREVYLPSLFVSDPCPELSAMESFGVWTGRCSEQETIGEPNFPRLKSLDLWGPFSTPLLRSVTVNPLPLLNRLRFKVTRYSQTETRVTFPTYYDHVESLHLDYHAWVHFGRAQDSQPLSTISLPLLKNLAIISLEPINARSLLPPLHIPSLEKLRLGVPQGFDEEDDIMFGRASISWVFKQHYLVDIFDSLIHLTIDNASLTGNDIRQWLPKFVNLGSLKIVARVGARSFINEAFFSALAPITSQTSLPVSRACPKLERLVLRRVSFLGRSADDLVSFVRDRSRIVEIDEGPRSGSRHLKYLEVMRCQGISSRHLGDLRRSEVSGAMVNYRPVSSSSCERTYPFRGESDSEESGNSD